TAPAVASAPSPSPSQPAGRGPTPPPTPGPTRPAPAAAAERIWGDWVADVQLGLAHQGPRIQFSIEWGDAGNIWVQTNYTDRYQVSRSQSVTAPEGQLRMTSKTTADGCQAGDVGTYAWTRPGDGIFMTLTLVADDCAARARTLARTWVHTLSAVTDG